MNKIITNITDKSGSVRCDAEVNKQPACKCMLNISKTNGKIKWTITSWFTDKKFMHRGIGKYTMSKLFEYCKNTYGIPADIEYVWNGANEYVMDWLSKNFDAVCTCPIAIQKKQADDDWESHIYVLNRDKVLAYFQIAD